MKTRNSNVELIRIICMVLIVGNHYASFGFFSEDIMYTTNKYVVDIMFMPGKVAVNLFVLISGYYMVENSINIKKLMSIMFQVWFYTLGALVLYMFIAGTENISLHLIKISLLPLSTSHYWFVSYYVILLVLSPFLNIMIKNLSQRQHALLALFLFMLCTVLPEVFGIKFAEDYLWLFVALYVTAAYCRFYMKVSERNTKTFTFTALVLMLIAVIRVLVNVYIGQKNGNSIALENTANFIWTYSPLAFITALAILLAGVCRTPTFNKTICTLGSLTFGVYLFHTNQIVNTYMWQKVFHTSSYAQSPYLIVHAAITVAFVYAAGSIIEFVRKKTVGPLMDSFGNWAYDKATITMQRLLKKHKA